MNYQFKELLSLKGGNGGLAITDDLKYTSETSSPHL
jgi:hypothetical protein